MSVPTARRDLEALAASGVPVYPVSGRGGGWQLVGGARTNLTGLTRDEAHDLFGLLGRVRSTSPAETVGRAVALGRCVAAQYRGKSVRFAPLGIGARGDHWYALAVRPDGDRRLFRLDRLTDVSMLDERAEFPEALDFATAWDEAVRQMESLRGAAAATVVVSARAAQPLMDAFGVLAEVTTREAEQVTMVVRAQDERALAEQLAGWIAVAEVREPASVRTALASLGERLVQTYAE